MLVDIPSAFNYIDWMPLTELLVLLKFLLIPVAIVGWAIGRVRERRGGLKAHESAADDEVAQPMWVNHSLTPEESPPSGGCDQNRQLDPP